MEAVQQVPSRSPGEDGEGDCPVFIDREGNMVEVSWGQAAAHLWGVAHGIEETACTTPCYLSMQRHKKEL